MKKPQKQGHMSGKDKRAQKPKTLRGLIRTTGKGMGFVDVPELDEDVVVYPEFMNTALNGDTVEIILQPKNAVQKRRRDGKSEQTGQVVDVLRRARKQFVGILIKDQGQWKVWPDDRKIYVKINIPHLEHTQATEGVKVLARITEWNKFKPEPVGEVMSVLGKKGDHETEIQSIILDRGIDTTFPADVEREANAYEHERGSLNVNEVTTRKDMRNVLTMTIDPENAKDFDDALSLQTLPNGNYEIGVHIADVSHYVRPNTALDREALNRATSIYLVDRTIPMLPEILSNDLCSLNPNEEKYAFSAVFEMDIKGHILKRWFGKTAIKSDKRFTYETAQKSIDNPTGEYHNELVILNTIAKSLQHKNRLEGAINFETEEVKFKLDETGRPVEVIKKEALETHKLIEAFMLLANREVAKFIHNYQKDKPGHGSLYRIHDLPDTDRIEELALFIKALGFSLPVKGGKVTSKDINTLLKSIEGTPEESLIKTATIRSMSKAIYSSKNIGHFGLAFEFYTHFTSPIRRYPDLVVHRVLFDILNKQDQKAKDEIKSLEHIARHSTDKEIAAAEAERTSIKLKQVEYMSERIGQDFDGIISGVTEWGIFVEEENTKCDGMVPLRELNDDYYTFNRRTYSIEGQRTKKKYRLGDKVRFRVMKADLDAKTLDYRLI